jgi:hypothetical protein
MDEQHDSDADKGAAAAACDTYRPMMTELLMRG